MAEPGPRIRLVADEAGPSRRRRGPGAGVLLVGLYALLFGAGLWLMRAGSPLFRRSAPGSSGEKTAPGPASPRPLSRQALLGGAELSPLASAEYARRLSTDCCPCGCDLNLRDCLVSDEKCTISPESARRIARELE